MKRNILLIITGSVAAYKSVDLIRIFKKADYEVNTIMTKGAKEFVTPLLVSSISYLVEEKFPTFKISREGKSSTWRGPRRAPRKGRRRLKYDRSHMAKAQKLTSLKRT